MVRGGDGPVLRPGRYPRLGSARRAGRRCGCLTGSPELILGLRAATLRSIRGSQIGASCCANGLARQVALFLMPQRVPGLGRRPGQRHPIRRQVASDAGAPKDRSGPAAAGLTAGRMPARLPGTRR